MFSETIDDSPMPLIISMCCLLLDTASKQKSFVKYVDLAGSEDPKTGENDARFKEGTNINNTLVVLGRIIRDLSENQRVEYWRESLLTQVLKPSLRDNSLATIICTVTPLDNHNSETVKTLE